MLAVACSLAMLYFRDQPQIVDSLTKVELSVHDEQAAMTFEESADKLAAEVPAMCKAIHMRCKRHKCDPHE